jgi:hypothetical protein
MGIHRNYLKINKLIILQMDNKFFIIDNYQFFQDIKSCFKNYTELLHQVKIDYHRQTIKINNKHYDTYLEFLEYISQYFPDFLEKILLISNQCVFGLIYTHLHNLLAPMGFHLVSPTESEILINFTINKINKQVVIEKPFEIIKIDDNYDTKKTHKNIRLYQIINLATSDPITIKLQYL